MDGQLVLFNDDSVVIVEGVLLPAEVEKEYGAGIVEIIEIEGDLVKWPTDRVLTRR